MFPNDGSNVSLFTLLEDINKPVLGDYITYKCKGLREVSTITANNKTKGLHSLT